MYLHGRRRFVPATERGAQKNYKLYFTITEGMSTVLYTVLVTAVVFNVLPCCTEGVRYFALLRWLMALMRMQRYSSISVTPERYRYEGVVNTYHGNGRGKEREFGRLVLCFNRIPYSLACL